MDEAAPILNIRGQRVGLGPLRREHLPLYVRWLNDLNTSRYLGIPPRPMTLEQEEAWHERASVDDSRYPFAIYELASGRPIGNCGLHSVDWPNRRTTIGILIGEAEARGQGYGTEAMQLLVDYAFTALGLHSLMLWVFEFNAPARRCYEKVGFRESGRRRASHWHNGRFWDEIMMDILADEFTSPVLRERFA